MQIKFKIYFYSQYYRISNVFDVNSQPMNALETKPYKNNLYALFNKHS